MGNTRCVFSSCRLKPPRGKKRQFFRFPLKDPSRLAKWIRCVKAAGLKNFVPSVSSRLCSDHFTEKDYASRPDAQIRYLRTDAVPSRFKFNTTNTKPNVHKAKQVLNRQSLKDQGIPNKSAIKSNRTNKGVSNPKRPSPSKPDAKNSPNFPPSSARKAHKYPTRNTTVMKQRPFDSDKGKSADEKPVLSSKLSVSHLVQRRPPLNTKLKEKLQVKVKEEKPDTEMEDHYKFPEGSSYEDLDRESIEGTESNSELEEEDEREIWRSRMKQDDMLDDLHALTLDPESLYRKLQKYRGEIPGLDVLIKMNRNLSAENEALRRRLTDVESRLDLWSVDKIAHDDIATRCYTGLPTYRAFLWLFTTLQPKVQSINLDEEYVTESEDQLEKSDDMDTEELPFIDQLLLVMMRLKVGLLIPDLASRFGIRNAQARSIFSIWMNAMEYVFRESYPLLPQHLMKLQTPADFRNYSSTRIILASICVKAFLGFSISARDCHKYPSRLKFLLGIMPNGVVCFVSQPFSENSPEVMMVQNSGILDLLQEGDCVMGYEWPEIRDVFLKNNISYIPFPKTEKEGLDDLMRISHLVESRLKSLKTFNILSETVPLSRSEKLGKIFTVCAFLINVLRTP